MLFKNVSQDVLNAAVEQVAAQSCTSLHWENFQKQGKNFRGVLRCNSLEKHARLSASGRRTTSANWFIHLWVMNKIFQAAPDAVIVTAITTYNGVEDFMKNSGNTYHHNVGTELSHVSFGEL